jgi:hypothetical protein
MFIFTKYISYRYQQCCGSGPGSGAFLPLGSGFEIRDDFFSGSRISDPYDVPNSIYLQEFTFKNGEKQEDLNFV